MWRKLLSAALVVFVLLFAWSPFFLPALVAAAVAAYLWGRPVVCVRAEIYISFLGAPLLAVVIYSFVTPHSVHWFAEDVAAPIYMFSYIFLVRVSHFGCLGLRI